MKHLNVQSATNAKNQDQVNIYSNFFLITIFITIYLITLASTQKVTE